MPKMLLNNKRGDWKECSRPELRLAPYTVVVIFRELRWGWSGELFEEAYSDQRN